MQLWHVAYHGKAIIDALGNQEANVSVQTAALNSSASGWRHHRRVTVAVGVSFTTPHLRDVASGRHCEYTQAWSACNNGYFRVYLLVAAIAKYSMRAQGGIERCSDMFAVTAGFGVNRRAFYWYDWCLRTTCVAHPLLRSPDRLRPADVGGLRSKQYVLVCVCFLSMVGG